MRIPNINIYLIRNYLESILRVSQIASSLGVQNLEVGFRNSGWSKKLNFWIKTFIVFLIWEVFGFEFLWNSLFFAIRSTPFENSVSLDITLNISYLFAN